jgi:hypothetical protein
MSPPYDLGDITSLPAATVPIPDGDLLVVEREYRCNPPEQGP